MNIAQIARHCGVSRSTVSYALSGKRTISAATRERVLAAVEELGYRPAVARCDATKARTGTIGLVVAPAAQWLTAMQLDFVGAVVDAAARADLDVLLSPSDTDRDASFERLLAGGRLDGLILMDVRLNDARVERLRHARVPFVTIGRTAWPYAWPWVDLETEALVGRCVEHLVGLGHRHLALINRPSGMLLSGYGPAHRARRSFAEASERRGVEGVEFCCADRDEAGERCVDRLLAAHPRTTAIVTINEAALPGIGRALERAGLDVPGDVSVTGLVGRPWAERFSPCLTAFDVPADQLCSTAVDLLRDRIARPDGAAARELLTPRLSAGDSTAAARRRR